ncbi:E3 ubiquitin-protein ligase E3D isoform X5 [Syngnathoides biaculeatus]|uniref:E3 ubiquitin-protein ligase E3D isoform X5 n=1 Tax=Syngnathoides biaculeatus TaxID=300417 RepID=UPI002ADDA4A5|nr:E3 ubiquitin-protein ligase E3D isoform X5 [Syngnathoides biaculeatus]
MVARCSFVFAKMPARCIAGHCLNTREDGFNFHKFARDSVRREKWIAWVQRTRASWVPNDRKVVAGNPPAVVVTGRDSSIHIRTPTNEVTLILPPGVSYVEESNIPTNGGESCEQEHHFRLQISVSHSKNEGSSDIVRTLRAQETYCFYCQSCKTRLLEDRDGNCEMTLRQEVSPTDSQNSQDPKKPCHRTVLVSCMSCSSVLGEVLTQETLKLYITQVVVESSVGDRNPESSFSRSFFLERTVAARLAELSISMSSFHFSVQTPSGKTFILLWLLNTDSIIASVPEWSTSNPTHHRPSLRATRALKLLFIACSNMGLQQQAIATSWEVNATGHSLVLPVTVCEELLRVIEDSNITLPTSMRHMRAYKVAYLRL